MKKRKINCKVCRKRQPVELIKQLESDDINTIVGLCRCDVCKQHVDIVKIPVQEILSSFDRNPSNDLRIITHVKEKSTKMTKYVDSIKDQRRLEINPEEIELIPQVAIKDPSYCFSSIVDNDDELNFIYSLSQEDWEEIGEEWFDEMTQSLKDHIFKYHQDKFVNFLKTGGALVNRDRNLDDLLEDEPE